jgi:exopolysaccharide biosynthesis polyprenyl glycosylphosphotransferase
VSSVSANPTSQESHEMEWARLIPGETPEPKKFREKLPASVKPFVLWKDKQRDSCVPQAPERRERMLEALLPRPLQSRAAEKWIVSMVVDFGLVALNWMLVGALGVRLPVLFPGSPVVSSDAGAAISLMGIAILQGALITLLTYSEGLHADGISAREQARILGKAVLWATAILVFEYGVQGASWKVSALLSITGLMHFFTLWLWRWNWAAERDRLKAGTRNVLIVGAGPVGRSVSAWVEQNRCARRQVYGFLDDAMPLGNGVIGRVTDLARMARQGFVDEVILAGPHDSRLTHRVLDEAMRLRLDVEIVPDLFGCKPAACEVGSAGDLPVICLHSERLPALGLIGKRALDVLGAGFVLASLAPLLAAIAILIKLDSRGPVLYCAQRAGRKGKLFRCYKFRTMVSNADHLKERFRRNNERAGPFFKIAGDPRITRAGRVLRRYSLDELPQLLNVMKGEMSLVGPRPHPVDDVAGYQLEHLSRLDVTPGITGLWQVTARRDPSFQRGMELDRDYIRRWSLGLDMKILLKTVLAVVRGSGE